MNERVYRGATDLQRRVRALLWPLARRAWRIEVSGLERVPVDGPAVVCANHVSFLDSAVLMLLMPRPITFVGKSEYMDSWKTRRLFPAMGMIPIDRGGGERSEAALAAAERVLRNGGLFGIFPEGTRSRDGMLYRGKTGAARLAARVGCPILPVGIVGTREIQPPGARAPRVSGAIRVTIGAPVHPGRGVRTGDGGSAQLDGMELRAVTDEVMFEIMTMTGQPYRNVYAGGPSAPQSVPVVDSGPLAARP